MMYMIGICVLLSTIVVVFYLAAFYFARDAIKKEFGQVLAFNLNQIEQKFDEQFNELSIDEITKAMLDAHKNLIIARANNKFVDVEHLNRKIIYALDCIYNKTTSPILK